MPAKAKTPAIESVEQLHETIDEIARLEVEQRRLEAERDQAIQVIRDEHDGAIEAAKKRIKALLALAETYGLARREAVFGKTKSSSSKLARFGFREGNPALCLLNRKWTWAMVLDALKTIGRSEFVRTTEEVDKDKLKIARLSDSQLAEIGCRLDQTERFFVEPKSDDAERITTPAA